MHPPVYKASGVYIDWVQASEFSQCAYIISISGNGSDRIDADEGIAVLIRGGLKNARSFSTESVVCRNRCMLIEGDFFK